ncbi:uridylate kinase PUMPKIN, chloroplastic isoform X2 [Spinacia oleracea]|uniref:UMP kinase n=1 Tax=Spinacia oleracea TaxID=3562 RepID=A0A9R0JFI6_SPIOL|nr:uridylate kinase PUMPKIN, chloroplastic isoform X2 [Spinacia oleracea]
MASCDDDFSLLAGDDHHHHHHHHLHQFNSHHRYLQPKLSSTTVSAISNDAVKVSSAGGGAGSSENGGVFEVNPYESSEFDSVPDPESDPKNSRVCTESADKRKDRERDDLSDGSYKKTRLVAGAGGVLVSGAGDYRKDREEWSDTAIDCLLDAYTDKYTQLNRGNLRGRDWEEVAAIVSDRCENQHKSVEQCKNKVDNLKKRYKLERHRMSSAGILVSHWPWFKKMEAIVGNSLSTKSASDDDKISGSSGNAGRQHKRYSVGTPGSVGQVNHMKSKSISNSKWQRVVFKISGAALAGNGPHNVDPKVAIVIGGRNFFCGDTWITATGAERSTTYQIGMMATVMNSVLLQSALEKMGVQTRVQTAFTLPEVGEPYNRQRAIRHLEKGRVVIFGGVGGGSGNPLFSTDTTAALRATDLNAQAVLKGINVDTIYDCNSRSNGLTFEHISFREVASRGASSMDVMALTFCEENAIPVVVFNLLEPGNISRALCGEQIGTLIDQTGIVS